MRFSFSKFLKNIKKPWGDSKQILQHTITINIALLSVFLAIYIAFTAYYIPQIHQKKLSQNLLFREMLDRLKRTVPKIYTHEETFYKNDTINIDLIYNTIWETASISANMFDNKEFYSVEELTLNSFKHTRNFSIISLISEHPIQNIDANKILKDESFPKWWFSIINDFTSSILGLEWMYVNKDISLILYCSDYTYSIGSDGDITWLHTQLDSLKREYLRNPSASTKSGIDWYEKTKIQNKKSVYILNNFYENIRSIRNTYIKDINNLIIEEESYKNILGKINSVIFVISLIITFLWNIILPVILLNLKKMNGKIALLIMIIGFILYFPIFNVFFDLYNIF